MKTVRFATFAGLFALAACSESPVDSQPSAASFSRNGVQQSVTGHIERDIPAEFQTQEKYSFSAIRNPNGTVNGRFEVRDVYDFGVTDRVRGVVTCFEILPDGKTARLAGVVTSSTHPAVPAGMEARWIVRDEGEGQDLNDWATDLSYGYLPGTAEDFCAGNRGIASYPPNYSLRGNVQVRP